MRLYASDKIIVVLHVCFTRRVQPAGAAPEEHRDRNIRCRRKRRFKLLDDVFYPCKAHILEIVVVFLVNGDSIHQMAHHVDELQTHLHKFLRLFVFKIVRQPFQLQNALRHSRKCHKCKTVARAVLQEVFPQFVKYLAAPAIAHPTFLRRNNAALEYKQTALVH